MKKLTCFLLIGLVAHIVGTAFGQLPARKQDRWATGWTSIRDRVEQYGQMDIARVPEVRAELKVSAEQAQELQRREIERRKAAIEVLTLIAKDAGDSMTLARRQEIMDAHRADARATGLAELKEILTDKQMERISEINIQLLGVLSLDDAELQGRLNMSLEQKEYIMNTIQKYYLQKRQLETSRSKMMQVLQAPSSRSGEAPSTLRPETIKELDRVQAQLEALRVDADRAILRTLSRRQRETFAKLAGAPFEMVKEMTRPGSLPELTQPKEKRLRKDDPKPKADGKAEASPAAEAKKG